MLTNIQVTKAGVQAATSAISANLAIPTDGAGNVARFFRVAATTASWVRWGVGAQTAVAGDTLIQPGDSLVVGPTNANNIAALQVSAPGIFQVTALDNAR